MYNNNTNKPPFSSTSFPNSSLSSQADEIMDIASLDLLSEGYSSLDPVYRSIAAPSLYKQHPSPAEYSFCPSSNDFSTGKHFETQNYSTQPSLSSSSSTSTSPPLTTSTTLAIPSRQRSTLAPTTFQCTAAVIEIILAMEYFLDVICGAKFRFHRERCHWECELFQGSMNCNFSVTIYQDESQTTHSIEFLLLQGEHKFFYSLYSSFRQYLADRCPHPNQSCLPKILGSSSSSSSAIFQETEDESDFLPPPPPTPTSLSTSEDIANGISSLKSLLLSQDPTMRIEALKIITELLTSSSSSPQQGDQSDYSRLIQGLYQCGVVSFFIESLQHNFTQNSSSSSTSFSSGSVAHFEFHLLMRSLGRIVQSKIIQEAVLFTPSLLCTLHAYLSESKSFSEESKRTAEFILRELISHSMERALPILGQRIVNRYTPLNLISSSPSQREGKIARQQSRSPPLSCAT